MFQRGLRYLVIFSILLLINGTSALKCWRCSSDSSKAQFCGKTLDLSQITDEQKKRNYVECIPSPKDLKIANAIPKCRIMVQEVYGNEIYARSCHWEKKDVPPASCWLEENNVSFVKPIACITCTEDGCNDKLEKDKLDNIKLANVSEQEEHAEVHTEHAEIHTEHVEGTNEPNSDTVAVLSKAIFVTFVLSLIIAF